MLPLHAWYATNQFFWGICVSQMGFEKFVARISDSLDKTTECYRAFATFLQKPCLMAVVRYHYENDRILRAALKSYIPDIVAQVQKKGLGGDEAARNVTFLMATCEQMSSHVARADKSHVDMAETARACAELLNDGADDYAMVRCCAMIVAQNSTIESAMRTSMLRCCNQFTSRGMICVLPESL